MAEAADVKLTHGVVEYGKPTDPADNVKFTHAVIEYSHYPANAVEYCHGVIEIAFPTNWVPPPPPPPGGGGEFLGNNNRMLLLDLSGAAATVPDYDPANVPDYA